MRESDAFDDDDDHWGLVPAPDDDDPLPMTPQQGCGGFALLVTLVCLAALLIWTRVLFGR